MGCCGGGVKRAARRAAPKVVQDGEAAKVEAPPAQPAKPKMEPVLVKNKGAYYRPRKK